MWIYLGLTSAFFLGFYNIAKKHAVKENAVLPVLFFSTGVGALLMLCPIILSCFMPEILKKHDLYVATLPPSGHLYIFIKAVILGISWVFGYFSLKHLPISIVQPIRASSSIYTIIGALIIFQETPPLMQWIGIAVILFSYFIFSMIGKNEGIIFHKNKWVLFMLLSTMCGAASGLYDKFLITSLNYTPITLLAWFSVYLFIFNAGVTLFCWFPTRTKTTPFTWKWSIPCIAILLACADLVYFTAINNGANLIVLSPVRRSNVIIAFIAGGLIFKEKNKRQKALALAGVLTGVIIIIMNK